MILYEAILNLQSNVDLIVQNQGINIAIQVISKHANNKDLLICCFKSLSQIALSNDEYRSMCIDAKCVEYI